MRTIIVMMVMMLIFFLVLDTAQAFTIDQDYPATGVHSFEISHTEGNVTLSGGDDKNIHIKANKISGDDACVTQIQTIGNAFFVKTDRSVFGDFDCRVNINALIPKGLSIKGNMGAANTTLEGLEGNIELHVGAGSVLGNVATKTTLLEVGAGKVDLTWTQSLTQGSIDVKNGAGDVNFQFPQGMVIDAHLKQGLGFITNSVQNSPSSQFKINGKVGFGRIQLQYK